MIEGAAAAAVKEYTYSSGVTQFQNTPVVLEATDLQVIYVGASGTELLLTNIADYTVSNVGTSYSASLVTLTAVGIAKLNAAGASVPVTCQRVMSATQEIDYIAMDNFPAENTERGLDKLTLLIAQASAGVVPQDVRSLQFPASDPDSLSPIIPEDSTRANKVLSFDANGEPTVTDLGSGTIGGMTGPSSQVEGNLALYDAVNGVLKQDNNIHESLFKQQTLNWLSTTTWDSDLGHIATVTVATGVTTNPTFNVTNLKPGKYSLIYIQDATGGAEPSWGAMFNGTPTVKTGANEITTLEFVSDGTKLYGIGNSSATDTDDTGSVKAFAYDFSSDEAGVGYLYANGQEVSETTYANLFAKIGTTYNAHPTLGAPSAGNFRLPDYRGYFLRGLDAAGSNVATESGRALSPTAQAEETASNSMTATGSGTAASAGAHTHDITFKRDNFEQATTLTDAGYGDEQQDGTSVETTASAGAHTHTVSTTVSFVDGDETRPVNMAVFYGIKY